MLYKQAVARLGGTRKLINSIVKGANTLCKSSTLKLTTIEEGTFYAKIRPIIPNCACRRSVSLYIRKGTAWKYVGQVQGLEMKCEPPNSKKKVIDIPPQINKRRKR